MKVYYNEWEPYAAAWLRNLIAAGKLPAGDVDERGILDVKADDLKGYTQCHFFAGIGGWPLALRLAGFPDTRPVWTGSCPCQPFSVAGKAKAQKDERHLWPVWFRLIAAVRPGVVFGEQVAGAIAHGWLDDALDDLEREGYQTGAAVLPACSVGAPHRRDRLWFVADSESGESRKSPEQERQKNIIGRNNESGLMGFPVEPGLEGYAGHEQDGGRPVAHGSVAEADTEWLECPDGKVRPVKSGICLLAHGVPARVGRLRAYGNAIVPQLAAEFIRAYMECEP